MGLVKIPKSAIEFFKKNQDEIFNSGNLSEGPWIDKLSNKIKTIAGVKNAIPVNSNGSGLVALLLIFKEYFGRSEIMIQSNTMYGVRTICGTAGYKIVDYINCRLETLMPNIQDIKLASEMNADCVEIHTGKICNLYNNKKNYKKEFNKIKNSIVYANKIGLEAHVGHGITFGSAKLLAKIKGIKEFNIGHFLIGESIFVGIKDSIKLFKRIIKK